MRTETNKPVKDLATYFQNNKSRMDYPTYKANGFAHQERSGREHRLFLSATPHNGLSSSFSALLGILEPQRLVRGEFPRCYAMVSERVCPGRMAIKRASCRERWWQFTESQNRANDAARLAGGDGNEEERDLDSDDSDDEEPRFAIRDDGQRAKEQPATPKGAPNDPPAPKKKRGAKKKAATITEQGALFGDKEDG